MRPKASRADKALDKKIEAIFYRTSSGIQINIFDIAKIFAAGRAAALAGGDIEAAVVTAVAAVRVN